MEVSADDLIHDVELPERANSGPLLVPTYITYLTLAPTGSPTMERRRADLADNVVWE